MKVHKVEPGECLSSIAEKYGFHQWKTVYDASENADLRTRRPNPNVLISKFTQSWTNFSKCII